MLSADPSTGAAHLSLLKLGNRDCVPDVTASMRWSADVIDKSSPNGRKYLCLGKVPIKQSMRILETEVKVAGAPDTDQARPHQTSPIPSFWEKGHGQEGTQTEGR